MPKPAKKESPTLDELESLVEGDPGPDTVRDALKEAIEEHGMPFELTDLEKAGAEEKPKADSEKPGEKKTEAEKPTADETPAQGAADEKSAAEAKEESDEEEGEEEGEEGDEEESDEQKTEAIEPPADWTATEHESFRALTPEGQKFVLDRVSKAEESAKTAKESLDRMAGLEKVLAPRRQAIAMSGMDEAQYITQLLTLSDFADKDFPGFVRYLAKARNIDLKTLLPTPEKKTEPGDDPYADDPVVQMLRSELMGVRDELAAVRGETTKVIGTLTERENLEKQVTNQQIDGAIIDFQNAKDSEGKPKHPYFEQVKTTMGSLMIAKGPDGKALASDMESAYEMACRAHPDVFAKIESARKAKETREQAEASRKKATKARITGSSVTGSPGPHEKPAPTGNIREDLAQAFASDGGVRL